MSLPIAQQTDIPAAIRTAVEAAIPGAKVEASGGSGHFVINCVSEQFDGKSILEQHRMVLGAITHLMSGPDAPVHAVDSITTSTP